MNLTALALKNTRLVWVAMVLILFLGIKVYNNFPSREDPLIRISRALLVTQFPGMPTEQVENLITKKIEEGLKEVSELEYITSTSSPGQSIIYVSAYEHLPDFDKVWDKVRRKVELIRGNLPSGVIGPILNDEFGDVAIVTAALTGDGWNMGELHLSAREIRDQIYTLDGVKRVTFYGVQEQRVFLDANQDLSQKHGIDLKQVVSSIQDQNTIAANGVVYTKHRELTVATSGKLQSANDLKQLNIKATGGVVPLTDYVEVREGVVEPVKEMAFYNGKPAIYIAISMQKGRNILEVGPRLKHKLAKINNGLPVGQTLTVATFQPDVVEKSINSVQGSLYQTLFIVLAIVILALGVREGVIVGVTVPLTILATLLVMFFMEIDLQFISLASLIISLGMLVDNGIVITESIHLKIQQGQQRMQAALESSKELALPLLTSTFTTVLAFAPILMSKTASGEYTRSLAQVVSISLLASWVISLTIVPALSVKFIKPVKKSKPFVLARLYRGWLQAVLNKPKLSLLSTFGIFIISLALVSKVPVEMFPISARTEVMVHLNMPAGYKVEQTAQASAKLATWLNDKQQNPDVDFVASYIGTGGPRFFLSISPASPASNRSFMIVSTRSPEAALKLKSKIKQFALEQLPTANVRPLLIARGTVPPGVVQLRFSGPDSDKLFAVAKQAEAALAAIPGVENIENDWQNRIKRFYINIDQEKVRHFGLSYGAIFNSLNGVFSGAEITKIRTDELLIPVVIKGEQEQLSTDQITNLLDSVKIYLPGPEGQYIALSQVAELEATGHFGSIIRRNLNKTVTVGGSHVHLKSIELQKLWDENLAQFYAQLPDDITVELGGELEGFENSAGSLFITLPLFFGLILAVIVAQFGSFRKTAIVAATIPLAFSGGFIGLFVMGANFDFIGALGFLSLAGIIINNAIVLIDKITSEQNNGLAKPQAIMEACVNRLRPILITTATTVLALIPLTLMEEQMFFSMASVIIFGLLIGTVMTLGALPALCALTLKQTKRS